MAPFVCPIGSFYSWVFHPVLKNGFKVYMGEKGLMIFLIYRGYKFGIIFGIAFLLII
jgi:hypothetical protein